MKNNDMLEFDIREINFSGAKMFKMGFFIGLGMTAAKVATVVLGGKLAVNTAKKAAKNGGTKVLDSVIDGMKEIAEKRMADLSVEEMEELNKIMKKVAPEEEKEEEK